MYEPYAYTTRAINKNQFTYPGEVPLKLEDAADANSQTMHWNLHTLRQLLQPVLTWQKKYDIPASRILVGEFGCDRTSNGAEKYLSHLIDIFNINKWDWAFYSFREDCWDSMDYELGSTKELSWKYWEALELGTGFDTFRKDNFLFDVIKKDLKPDG